MYRSNVKIMIGLKAFEILKKNCLNSFLECAKDMVTDEYIQSKNDSYVLIGWEDCRWIESFDDVKVVENTLKQLDDIVECEPDSLKDYFYKKIEMGEDNATKESTNDYYNKFVGDFFVECNFSL